MKIYIAGPMTGIECYNFERFFYMAARLRAAGHEVINPAQVDTEKMLNGWQYTEDQYNEVLLKDLTLISGYDVDAIMMLDGYEESKGARAELHAAIAFGKVDLYETEWDNRIAEYPFESNRNVLDQYIEEVLHG